MHVLVVDDTILLNVCKFTGHKLKIWRLFETYVKKSSFYFRMKKKSCTELKQ